MPSGLLGRVHSRSSSSSSTGSKSEKERLDLFHIIHLSLLEPHHSSLIGRHLAEVHATGRRSRVLDVGTGTGTWAINTANTHPHADVTGIDIEWSNFRSANSSYGNVDFQSVDVTAPLPWPANTFDVIHVKSMLLDVPDYSRLIERLAVVLRHGGLLVVVENEPFYHAGEGTPSDSLGTWASCVREAYSAKGIDIDLASRLNSMLSVSGVFSSQFYFQELGIPVGGYVTGVKSLKQQKGSSLTFPSLPSESKKVDSRTLARVGRQHSSVISAELKRLTPIVLGHGYRRADVESLVKSCIHELCAPSSRCYQRLFAVYAYKAQAIEDQHRS